MTHVQDLLDWTSTEEKIVQVFSSSPLRQELSHLVENKPLILLRNWYGKLALLLPCSREKLEASTCSPLIEAMRDAAGALALRDWDSYSDELFGVEAYWNDPALIDLSVAGDVPLLKLLERQDKENDWLRLPNTTMSRGGTKTPARRCVFFSIKGGVGRSTALAMLSIELARIGKKVLVVDGDFESPGLSSSLLPKGDGQPDYGAVDWLAASALGADQAQLNDMALNLVVEACPLNAELRLSGQIFVAPAYGRKTQAYVSKLARVYRRQEDGQGYADRLAAFLAATEAAHNIDVTLFDCRSGIDDTAAAAITHLHSDLTLLFAVNTQQTWDAYELLFTHLRRNLNLFKPGHSDGHWDLRQSLRVVSALTPQESVAPGYVTKFKDEAYEVLAQIYDDDNPDGSPQTETSAARPSVFEPFSPSPDAAQAPHDPLWVKFVDDLRAFDPLSKPGQVTDPLNRAAFEHFLQLTVDALGLAAS
jgi:MinD-like ATPase involved in chromosome partitioning or flagellar assembly